MASTISEQDVLSHAHVRNLGVLQAEIQRLRADLPSVLKPIMSAKLEGASGALAAGTGGARGSDAAASNGTKADNPQADFRERAVNLQRDTRQLIKHLEEMCDTLEATERIRNEDKAEQSAAAAAAAASASGKNTPSSTNGKRLPFERIDVLKGQKLADAPTSPRDPLASIGVAPAENSSAATGALPSAGNAITKGATPGITLAGATPGAGAGCGIGATPLTAAANEVEAMLKADPATPAQVTPAAVPASAASASKTVAATNPSEVPAVTEALASGSKPDTADALALPTLDGGAASLGATTELGPVLELDPAASIPLDDTLFSDLEAAGDFDWSAFGQTPPSTL